MLYIINYSHYVYNESVVFFHLQWSVALCDFGDTLSFELLF